jgi:Leucine-rich repeat (LRR) protein
MDENKATHPPKESFEVDDISIDEDDVAVIVDDDHTAATDGTAFVVDDLEDHPIHDQLPSVEEAKASLPHQVISTKRRNVLCYFVAGITTLILVITMIAVAVDKNDSNNKNTPTSTELTGRFEQVAQYLVDNGIATLPSMKEQKSPQRLAALFVADADLYQADMDNPTTELRFIERYVLALIYFEMNGPDWYNNYKFLSARDYCDWSETITTPSGRTFIKGVECDQDRKHVIGLDLSDNNLVGYHINDEIQFFTKLEKLHWHKNKLGGALPYTMKSLKNLKSVGLMDAALVGTVPDWIGDLTQLTSLGLSGNDFHGSIPTSMTKLTDLRILGLDGLGLSGNIEHLQTLKKLEALYLQDNSLTGNLDGDWWPVIRELDVSNNLLDGTLPSTLFHHQHLTILDVHHNMFYGDFPEDIVSNDQLELLCMEHNDLSGSISDRIGFLKNLKHLDISMNGFTGTLPDTIQELTDLRHLTTSGNKFAEQPLMDLSMLSQLQDVSMKGNNLIGTLPESLGMLTNLQLMDFDGNHFSGSIPTWFGLLARLDHLLLNRNELSGSIPHQLSNLHGLRVLLLDGNNLTGNANTICDARSPSLAHFIADCYPGRDGSPPEVECRCCTMCCSDDDPECNNKAWTSNYDPKYQYGYIRQEYGYSLDQAPEEWSKVARESGIGSSPPPSSSP